MIFAFWMDKRVNTQDTEDTGQDSEERRVKTQDIKDTGQ